MRFDPNNGSKPTQATVKTGTLADPPQQNPQREGFRFDGWTLDGQPFDLQTPFIQDTTLKAQWSKTTDWTLSPDHGPATGARLTINTPGSKEPGFSSVHAAGDQVVSLTGDGRIYTWTQDSTPKQAPSPAQAPDGFRYLQAAAGSRSQAALGSDQRIYTWASRQATPTILDTGKDAGFTSISMDDDRLLAVDRQGRVHAFRTSQADSQNQNPKCLEHAAASLPGKAQAVTAAASGSRILIVDADGLAWTWEMSSLGKAEPARVKQQTETRIVQAQALNQGFLLLDADGQARYLAGSTASMTPVSLPDGAQASRITANKDQAVITDADGRVWAWKPGKTPIRADDGNQAYVQAAAAGSRISAISRQGSMLTWSLDAQGNPGKPVRLDTTQAPTLASASLDGQALPLSRNNDAWQVQIPARKPGQAAILITGRQDGQPFARSLAYTVDQPLARAAESGSAFTVRFDTGGGNPKPADQHVPSPYGRVKRPSPDPAREGFLFDGWFTGQVAYDFSRPVDKDLTLAAHWTPASRNTKWSISPNKGSQLGREPATITPPDNASRDIRFSQVSASANASFSLAVGSDGNAYAWGWNSEGQLGDGTRDDKHAPVMVRKPDRKTYPDLPADFTYLQVSAGGEHSLALGSDGNAYAWGSNGSGRLGDGTTSTRQTTPVRVKTPDRKTYPDLPEDFTYLQVSAGREYSLALGSDGNAYAWGNNYYGQLGDGTRDDKHAPVRVKTPDRKAYPDLPADFTYLQVSAGYQHSLALGSDGNAYAWGFNYNGQLGDGTTGGNRYTPVRVKTPDRKTYPDLPADFTYLQVSAGYAHSLALGSDGNAWAWGNNQYGQLGDGTTSYSQSAPVRVKTPDRKTYPDLPADFTYQQVSAGFSHSLALGSDGNAWAWGDNWYGNLGNNTASGTSDTNPVPKRVRDPASPGDASKGLQAAQVSAGYHHSLAVGSDGNAYAWGWNRFGQIGDGSTDSKSVPVPVSFNLALVITGVRFDQTPVSGLTRGDGSSVTVTTPAHQPGTVTVSVDYTLGGAPQNPDTSLRYTYLPAGVLPKAGGEGILLALITGTVSMGGVLASRRHRREQHQLSHASHE